MNLVPAKSFDINTIMQIERSAFIPDIQESQKTFEKRLSAFPEGFLLLQVNGQTAGYFCSEIWSSVPASDEIFSLGHDPLKVHTATGPVLYASSFALFSEYRGRGLAKPFFEECLKSVCGAFPELKTIILLVNEEWQGAKHIYESLGFSFLRTIPVFFPSLHHSSSDGTLMTAPASLFKHQG